jgi:NAD(P)H-hydrate epimerase
MRPVVTAAEMRALDRATIDDIGIPAFTLMETAGRAVASVAVELLGDDTPGGVHIAVVCGPGNNGGDGFVAARVLRDAGLEAVVYLGADRKAVKGDAAAHLAVLERAGGVVLAIDTPQSLEQVADDISHAGLVIDALFGVGLTRPVEGHFADIIDLMNGARTKLAVDIPSGLDADTGTILGTCVEADATVTMAALKAGLVSSPGFQFCGAITVADIGVPQGVLATQAVRAGVLDESDVLLALPERTLLDHKGDRGHVVVIGGMPGMRGAGRLCSLGALRGGAGLVTLATAGEVAADDSIMTKALATDLGELLAKKQAIVIGPGLGQTEQAARWVGEVLASGVAAVLDADALNLVAGIVETVKGAAGPVVLTPHPGEAARLLDMSIDEIESDRLTAARTLAAKSHAVVVLKGARTIICDGTLEDEFCTINPTGSPALATGGSGDVLAGLIGALLAQGLAAIDAARVGVYVHGLAGERLGDLHGGRGGISSDLPLVIAGVLRDLSRPA